jgi:hypothetical protein
VDAEALVRRALLDVVEQHQLVIRRLRRDVQILDCRPHTGNGKNLMYQITPNNNTNNSQMAGLLTFRNVLLERGELVEVRGEETEASNLVDDVPGGRKRIRVVTI